jgi:hypothetical protein
VGIWSAAFDASTDFEGAAMSALTSLGVVHTAASLIALAASALGIFQHAGFGPGHALAIVTLLALGIGTLAATTNVFGGAARYVQAAGYSSTILFHLIPGFTEALTRLPPGAPLLPSGQAPAFKPIYAVLALIFALAFTMQVRWLRRQRAA